MQKTETLKQFLSDLARHYADADTVGQDEFGNTVNNGTPAVRFSNGSSFAHWDGYIGIDVSARRAFGRQFDDVNELRTIVNTLSHEVEHLRRSDLKSKKRFVKEYPHVGELAGILFNTLEDQYIDGTRTKEWPGLRRTQAYIVDRIMGNDSRRPPMHTFDNDVAQAGEGIIQVGYSGTLKGKPDNPALAEWFHHFRDVAGYVRTLDDQDARYALARRSMDSLLDVLGIDELTPEQRKQLEEQADSSTLEPTNMRGGENPEPSEASSDDIPDDAPQFGQNEQAEAEQAEGEHPAGEQVESDAQPEGEQGEQAAGEQGEQTGSSTPTDGQPEGEQAEAPGNGSEQQPDDEAGDMFAHSERDGGDWWEVRDGDDYHEPSASDKMRADSYEQLDRKSGSDIEQERAKRDKNMMETESWRGFNGTRVRKQAEKSGVVASIQDSFRSIKNRDQWVSAPRGDRLHYRNAVRRLSGDHTVDDLYEFKQESVVGNRSVMVALDMSGSMSKGKSELHAKVALAGLAAACEEIDDTFGALAFHGEQGRSRAVHLKPITMPGEEFEYDHLDAVTPDGSTPTASGIEEAERYFDFVSEAQRIMFVITDGIASITRTGGYGRAAGVEDARKTVEHARQSGIAVIGIGLGTKLDEEDMADTFGADGYVVVRDTATLADELVALYQNHLPDAGPMLA